MGRFAIAICVVCLASGSSAIAQDAKPAAQNAREVRIVRTVSRLDSGEATNDGASRLAVRAAFSSDLTQQEKLGLLLLMSTNRRTANGM